MTLRIPSIYTPDHDLHDDSDDPILQLMKQDGIPITRANYIACNWPRKPRPWTAEHESELPEFLQDWDAFDGK
jgi:hypothetical protein